MTEQLSVALEREHRLIDDAFEIFAARRALQATDQQRTELIRAVDLLRRHIYLEEKFLFPPLRDAGLVGPVMVMVHEHGQMWPILDRLDQVLTTGPLEAASSVCQDLVHRLATHNMKEERILYRQADRLLPDVGLNDLLATTQRPPSWVCQGAMTA